MCSQNVQISMEVFKKMIELVDAIDPRGCCKEFQEIHKEVKKELYEKKRKIRNREAYSEIMKAQSEIEKNEARENYVMTKKLPVGF